MGVYDWTNTAIAITDGASIVFNNPTDPIVDYTARNTAYATDTITMKTPAFPDTIIAVVTYDPLSISPTSVTMGVSSTQNFTATGGCLNGVNCVGGARIFSVASGGGSINSSSGVYTSAASSGTAVIQVTDSIGNISTANVIVLNSLAITPTALRVPIYSTGIFSAILGTPPYTFSVPSGTGTVGCQSILMGTHTATATTITVMNTTDCPSVGSIIVGTETICYVGLTATTFTAAVRGCGGTTAASYIPGMAYNSARTVYVAPSLIGAATIRVSDISVPVGTSDAAVSIIRPVDIKVGQYSTCALYDEGSVKCWGLNSSGQLGIGSTSLIGASGIEVGGANTFVDLGTGRTATKISVGLVHACALLDNSTLKCWGSGTNGRLGRGSTTSAGTSAGQMGNALAAINLGTGRTAVETYAFGAHSCALLDNGTLKCWGRPANAPRYPAARCARWPPRAPCRPRPRPWPSAPRW